VTTERERFEIRVFAEGEETEELYLTHWNREHRDVNVVIARHQHTTPRELVQAAVAEATQDRRRSKRSAKNFDEYWCVFDIDEHPNLDEALRIARDNDIKVALSGPCLELWFILHFEDRNGYIDHRAAQKRAYELLGCKDKGAMVQPHVDTLHAMYPEAVRRAKWLQEKHSLDGTAEPWNPSSNMWELTETIKLGKSIANSGNPHPPRQTS